MTTISGNTITGTSSNDDIHASDLVSDTLTIVTINGGDGDDKLSDFIAKSRLTFINGGNGDDFMSGSSYSKAIFAGFIITGGYGVDRFYMPGDASGTPILTREKNGTEIQYKDIDGGELLPKTLAKEGKEQLSGMNCITGHMKDLIGITCLDLIRTLITSIASIHLLKLPPIPSPHQQHQLMKVQHSPPQ
jgi:hypothetical protein